MLVSPKVYVNNFVVKFFFHPLDFQQSRHMIAYTMLRKLS